MRMAYDFHARENIFLKLVGSISLVDLSCHIDFEFTYYSPFISVLLESPNAQLFLFLEVKARLSFPSAFVMASRSKG